MFCSETITSNSCQTSKGNSSPPTTKINMCAITISQTTYGLLQTYTFTQLIENRNFKFDII